MDERMPFRILILWYILVWRILLQPDFVFFGLRRLDFQREQITLKLPRRIARIRPCQRISFAFQLLLFRFSLLDFRSPDRRQKIVQSASCNEVPQVSADKHLHHRLPILSRLIIDNPLNRLLTERQWSFQGSFFPISEDAENKTKVFRIDLDAIPRPTWIIP